MLGFLKKRPVATKQYNEELFRKGFSEHLPNDFALEYVMKLWREQPFSFTVAGSRKSCLGNYMYKNGRHFISVNGDSNPYSFLVTLIHEIAHQRVRIEQGAFKRPPAPHGSEWKLQFKLLMKPLLLNEVFPQDILEVLVPHMQNPAASSTKDPALYRILLTYSSHVAENQAIHLSDLGIGQHFSFNGRRFKKIKNRRTRILAECIDTKKQYTISALALVEAHAS